MRTLLLVLALCGKLDRTNRRVQYFGMQYLVSFGVGTVWHAVNLAMVPFGMKKDLSSQTYFRDYWGLAAGPYLVGGVTANPFRTVLCQAHACQEIPTLSFSALNVYAT